MHHIVAPEISHGVAAVNAEGSFELRPDVDDVIGRRHLLVADGDGWPDRESIRGPQKAADEFSGVV